MPEGYRTCRANHRDIASRKLLGVKEKSKQTHRPLFVPRLAGNRLEKVLRGTKISLRTLGKWVEMRYKAMHQLEESGAV